jgi:Thioredoxin.
MSNEINNSYVSDENFRNNLERVGVPTGADLLREMRPVGDQTAGKPIEWTSDVRAAMQQSMDTGKPMVMLFTSPSCPWCKALERELSNPNIKSLADQAIFVRMEVKEGVKDDASTMFKMLGLEGYPTISVTSFGEDGTLNERKRLNGYFASNDLKTKIGTALRNQGSVVLNA